MGRRHLLELPNKPDGLGASELLTTGESSKDVRGSPPAFQHRLNEGDLSDYTNRSGNRSWHPDDCPSRSTASGTRSGEATSHFGSWHRRAERETLRLTR